MIQPATYRGSGAKRDSRATLFGLIHTERQTTRTSLARLSGLSKATVSSVIAELLETGLIRETGKHQPGRGRSQILLQVEPQSRLVLGAQLGDNVCTVVLADLYARLEREATVAVRGTAPQDFLDALCEGVDLLRPLAGASLLGLGVGAPGSVDAAGRCVTISVPHGWRDIPLADMLEQRLRLPVRVANRAKVAALGEHWHRMGQGIEHLAYVHVGSGIVAGLVIGGTLYFGGEGLAGELGHVTVLPDGPMCDCGNQGCLHTLASGSAIVRRARAKARLSERTAFVRALDGTTEQAALELVLAAAQDGDLLARATLVEASTYLGIAIANLVNLFNPQVVVVGGLLGRAGEVVLEPIRQEVRRRALPGALAKLDVVSTAFAGEEAGALGAAALFLQQLETLSGAVLLPSDGRAQ